MMVTIMVRYAARVNLSLQNGYPSNAWLWLDEILDSTQSTVFGQFTNSMLLILVEKNAIGVSQRNRLAQVIYVAIWFG